MLSPIQIQQRDGKLTASRIACLMTGDEAKILDLWRELTGDPSYEPEDLSGIWAVQLGSHTESLNLDWYERRTGKPLSKRGEVITHPNGWAACTLDAWDDDQGAPVECKHVGGFEKTNVILERYAPQAHWQMIMTGADKCIFSIIEGAREPIIETVPFDNVYAAELFRRAEAFMECVFNLTPPVVLPPVQPPVKAERVQDMTGNNHFAAEAITWLTTVDARKDNEAAERSLKKLVDADVARCFGHGIEIKRDRAGRLSVRATA